MQDRAVETRKALIDAACCVIADRGFWSPVEGGGLADSITQRGNLTKGALYYHFDGLRELCWAAAEHAAVEAGAAIADGRSPSVEAAVVVLEAEQAARRSADDQVLWVSMLAAIGVARANLAHACLTACLEADPPATLHAVAHSA